MSTNIFSMYKTDTNLEKTGVELNYGDNGLGEDTVIIVGRAGGSNNDYQKTLTAALRPYRKQIQAQVLDPKVWNKVLLEVYLKTVIKGARGLIGPDGTALEPTVENIREVLTLLPDLFEDVKEQASEAAIFRDAAVEDVAKNS